MEKQLVYALQECAPTKVFTSVITVEFGYLVRNTQHFIKPRNGFTSESFEWVSPASFQSDI